MSNPKTPKPNAVSQTTREIVDLYEAHNLALDSQRSYLNRNMRTMLKELIIERKSPGGKSFIKLFDELSDYRSKMGGHHILYHISQRFASVSPDPITRRAVYLEMADTMWEYYFEIRWLQDFCKRLNLTDENTKLRPEPSWMTAWHESRRREALRAAQNARMERSARRRIKARTTASRAASSTGADTKAPPAAEVRQAHLD